MLRVVATITFLLVSANQIGCDSANFSGSAGANEPIGDLDQIPSALPTQGACTKGDKVNVSWGGAIDDCLLRQGRTYNFDTNTCTEMRRASFDCNWPNVLDAMTKLGISTTILERDSQQGAKLVSCGQSADGNRIVAQWIKPPKGQDIDCESSLDPGSITTGCYTFYVNQEPPPLPTNVDEKRKPVFACMNSL